VNDRVFVSGNHARTNRRVVIRSPWRPRAFDIDWRPASELGGPEILTQRLEDGRGRVVRHGAVGSRQRKWKK